MNFRFVITLAEHRKLGFLFAPYLVKPDKTKGNYLIYDRITLLNLSTYEDVLSPEEIQLIRTIEEYNDQNLTRTFSKKKLPSREFIAGITEEMLINHIRPFIERRMLRCIDILFFNPIPIYFKILQNNIYESDRIKPVTREASAVFNFVRSAQEMRYFLRIGVNNREISLKGRKWVLAINDPCCIVIENDLYLFSDIDGKKLQPFFEKDYISIPHTAEKKFFETFVRNAIKKYQVNAVGFSISDMDVRPEAILSIEPDLTGRYFYILKFIYAQDTVYLANRKTELKVTCDYKDKDVSFTRIRRDYKFENNCITTLLSFGLVNRDGPFFTPLQKNPEGDHSGYNVINWINENKKLLSASGFQITQEKLDKNYYLDDFDLLIRVSDKSNDWFDVEAKVEFPGFSLPFTAFRENILKGEREFMLPDGRVVILPNEWFGNYRDVLNFSRVENGSIRLGKQHFPLVNKITGGISVSVKENLMSLIRKEIDPEIVPAEIRAELRSYQIEGYSWLYRLYQNGFGGCLADDMGLGKTLQTLTLFQKIMNRKEDNEENPVADEPLKKPDQLSLFDIQPSNGRRQKPSLIIVPTSLVHNWLNESAKFTPELKIRSYVGPARKSPGELAGTCDIIVTSYGILRNDLPQFLEMEYLYVVLDESQMIKNPASKTYQSVVQLRAENKIVLTGTPVENTLIDLWSQMNFLNPGLLGSLSFFQSEFQFSIEKKEDEERSQKLQKLISPFILRRTKMQVEPQLPPVSEQVIYCDMNERQETYYEAEKSKARNLIIEKLSEQGFHKSSVIILQSLTRLRQIANHPSMIDEGYFAGSGKYDEITRSMQNLLLEGHKALIFSSFVKHLSLVAAYLDKEGISYAWLTGETQNREKEISKFQNDKSIQFFLISLKAGGTGLNLTAAEYVFILDPWWNPASEMQAISRAHRIGQQKHVFVYRFISRNTLEEKIMRLQQQKSSLADSFINNSLKGTTEEEILELFN